MTTSATWDPLTLIYYKFGYVYDTQQGFEGINLRSIGKSTIFGFADALTVWVMHL